MAVVALGMAAPACAQQSDETAAIETAKALIVGGNFDQARTMLEKLFAQHPQDNEIEFLLGLVAGRSGEPGLAIRHFRAILVREPAAVRVRLELARALFEDGQYEVAFRQFQLAQAGIDDPQVNANINQYLSRIRAGKTWSYNFNLAIAPDTNINTATSQQETVVLGLPFALDESAGQQSGIGLEVGGGIELSPALSPRTRLRIGIDGERREYGGEDFDDTVLALHAGPKFLFRRWDLSVLGTAFQRIYGGAVLEEGVGARIEAFHQRDGRTALSLGASVQDLRFPRLVAQSGINVTGWGSVTRSLTSVSFVTAQAALSRQDARGDYQSYWWAQAAVGYYRDLPAGFSAWLQPKVSRSLYDVTDPFFGKRRQETTGELQVALINRRLVVSRFTPRVSYTFARRRSTIDIYNYTQHRIEMGLTAQF